jgi:hypothetical protein
VDDIGKACSTYERDDKFHLKAYSEHLKGRDHLGNQGVDGRILLKLILEKYCVGIWTVFIWLRIDPVSGFLRTLSTVMCRSTNTKRNT